MDNPNKEELLTKAETLYILFGQMSYFLVIEDKKPVIFAHAVSRMDLDSICFIDVDSWQCHDIYYPEKIWAYWRNIKLIEVMSKGLKA